MIKNDQEINGHSRPILNSIYMPIKSFVNHFSGMADKIAYVSPINWLLLKTKKKKTIW